MSRLRPIPIFQPCLLCNYGLAGGSGATGANLQPPGFSSAPRGGCGRPAVRGPPRGNRAAPGEGPRGGAGGRASPPPRAKGAQGAGRGIGTLQVPAGAAEAASPTIKPAARTWPSRRVLPDPFPPLPALPSPRPAAPLLVSGSWTFLPPHLPPSLSLLNC